jgi:hypothetical protein
MNEVQKNEWQSLLKRLQNNDPSLIDFYVSYQIGDAGAAELAIALKTNSTLEKLNLTSTDIGDAGLAALALMLKDNRTLKELYLDWNPEIGDEGAITLANAIKYNQTLKVLSLDNKAPIIVILTNKIGDTGWKALADSLISNHSLVVLNIDGNDINEEGMIAFATALKTNCTLRTFHIQHSKINDAIAHEWVIALRDNHTLTNLSYTIHPDYGISNPASIAEIEMLLKRNRALRDEMCKAVKKGDISAVNTCLQQRINLLAVLDDKYNTPLHCAVIAKQPQMAAYLINLMCQQKIPLDKRNNENKTAAALAKGTKLEALFTLTPPTLFFSSPASVKNSEAILESNNGDKLISKL